MKRTFGNTLNVNNNVDYTVVETIENDSAYVQFLPHIWLVQLANSKKLLAERDVVNFYFPSRMKNQSKDNYFKFVKHAKFICMTPENNGKWELRSGRILKMGLGLLSEKIIMRLSFQYSFQNAGTLEEALNAQKMYSDYFSTTEAEMALIASPPKRRVVKKEKAVSKAIIASDG